MMQYASTTTLQRIRDAKPCKDGWTTLLTHLGKTEADDEPLGLLTILDSNGLEDAIWVLSRAMPDDRLARHFQAWCAEHVLHIFERAYPGDMRVRDQIATLRYDSASPDARDAARAAAYTAVCAADANIADVARSAAWRAAWAAAHVSVYGAAWAAVTAERITADSAAAASAAGAAARAAQECQLRLMLGDADAAA